MVTLKGTAFIIIKGIVKEILIYGGKIMANKWVYMFSEGNMDMRNLLGGKGANLAEMTSIGLPVPQGFTITTEACTQYYEDGRKINDEIMAQTMEGVKKMEEINGKGTNIRLRV